MLEILAKRISGKGELVLVVPDWHFSVWAYLVVDHKHWTARRVQLKPDTQVLLVFGSSRIQAVRPETFENQLRDNLAGC